MKTTHYYKKLAYFNRSTSRKKRKLDFNVAHILFFFNTKCIVQIVQKNFIWISDGSLAQNTRIILFFFFLYSNIVLIDRIKLSSKFFLQSFS